jgi:ATP synthase protein I
MAIGAAGGTDAAVMKGGNKADLRRDQVAAKISQDAARKQRARAQERHGVWFGLGMFGLVGWAVALPTLLGTVLGIWLDARFPSPISWTITLLFIGVMLGCLNAWWWVNRESQGRAGSGSERK